MLYLVGGRRRRIKLRIGGGVDLFSGNVSGASVVVVVVVVINVVEVETFSFVFELINLSNSFCSLIL